jgi:hypothetical protein
LLASKYAMLSWMSMNGAIVKLITSPDYSTPRPHSRFPALPSPSPREPRLPFIIIALNPSIINAPSFNHLLIKTDYCLAFYLHEIATSLKMAKLTTKNTLIIPLPLVANINK